MILKTKRLLLRPWQEADAPDLYTYAKDGRVGVIAGWPPHKSVEESAEIIKTIFRQEGVYAVTLKKENWAIGCVGVVKGAKSHFQIGADEGGNCLLARGSLLGTWIHSGSGKRTYALPF